MSRSARRWGPWAAAAVVALFVVQSLTVGTGAASAGVRPAGQATDPNGLTAGVTFDSRATASRTSPTSAVPGSFASQLVANYTWSVPAGGSSVTVTAVRLYLRLLGVSIATKEVDVENAQPTVAGGPTGNISLVEDLSQYTYLVEGLYLATASIYANGTLTLLWSESFYVSITGPSHVTAVLVLLIAIALYEGYQIATIRREARRGAGSGSARSGPSDTPADRPADRASSKPDPPPENP